MRSAERGELENCKAATATTEESLVTAPETYLCIFFVNVVVFFASSVPQTKIKKKKSERQRTEVEIVTEKQTNKQTSMFDEKRRRCKRNCKTTPPQPPQEESSIALSKDLGTAASASCVSQLHM
jgi:uncharacterized membrane protein